MIRDNFGVFRNRQSYLRLRLNYFDCLASELARLSYIIPGIFIYLIILLTSQERYHHKRGTWYAFFVTCERSPPPSLRLRLSSPIVEYHRKRYVFIYKTVVSGRKKEKIRKALWRYS